MARSRNIKPGFFKNDLLAECQPLARLLFAGLWCEADRSGRLLDRPKKIKVDCLPYDECDCDQLLEELRSAGFIARYRISDIGYIQVLSFDKHQNPHKNEAVSELPAMPTEAEQYKHSTSTVQESKMDEAIGLIPDSLLLIPDTKKDQKTLRPPLREDAKPPDAATALLSLLPPDLLRDFKALRKAKKAPLTETAVKGLIREGGKAGIDLEEVARRCCENGWGGFKASWPDPSVRNQTNGNHHANHNLSLADRAAAIHANRGRDDAIDATFTPIDR